MTWGGSPCKDKHTTNIHDNMASQVKFHSVTHDGYDSIGTKDAGGLYFITDNGEIRKGDSHITGTRVYTAIDDSKSAQALEALQIQLGHQEITHPGVDQPKRGDVLVVTHYLTTVEQTYWEKDGEECDQDEPGAEEKTRQVANTTGPVEYVAYVYELNGGTYSVDGWRACDGSVDASKVILTSDITMAGNYAYVGNFNKGDAATNKTKFIDNDTKGTAGVSVYELIKQML